MPLSADRNLDRLGSPHNAQFGFPVAAGERVFRGSICAFCQDGTIVPAGTANPPSPAVGIAGLAKFRQDNTGTLPTAIGSGLSGPGPVECLRGTWNLPFDTPPAFASIGAAVYAVDDQTVSLTMTPQGGSARLQVGTLAGIDQASSVPFVTI